MDCDFIIAHQNGAAAGQLGKGTLDHPATDRVLLACGIEFFFTDAPNMGRVTETGAATAAGITRASTTSRSPLTLALYLILSERISPQIFLLNVCFDKK